MSHNSPWTVSPTTQRIMPPLLRVCVCVCVQDATPNVVDDFDRIFKLDKLHVLSSGSSRPPRGWDRNLTDDRGTVMTFKRRATKLGSTWSTDTGRHHPPYS